MKFVTQDNLPIHGLHNECQMTVNDYLHIIIINWGHGVDWCVDSRFLTWCGRTILISMFHIDWYSMYPAQLLSCLVRGGCAWMAWFHLYWAMVNVWPLSWFFSISFCKKLGFQNRFTIKLIKAAHCIAHCSV